MRTSCVRYPLLRRQPTERGIAYHNGILHRGIPLPWRQPPEGVSPFNYVNPQSGYPSFWRNPTLPRRQPTEGVPPLSWRRSHRDGGSIKFWVTIFSGMCLTMGMPLGVSGLCWWWSFITSFCSLHLMAKSRFLKGYSSSFAKSISSTVLLSFLYNILVTTLAWIWIVLNRRVTPPVGASSGVSLGGLTGKTVGGVLHRKNRPIEDERILDVSSDFLK